MRPKTNCPAEATLLVLGGSWKVPILWHLSKQVKRFSQLQRDLQGVTQKMLTQQLREMERHQIVARKVFAQVPPRVEYSLTPRGRSLLPVVAEMCKWGKRWQNRLDDSDPSVCAGSPTPAPSPAAAPSTQAR